MEYRNLGRTGIKVSALCLGSMQFGWTASESLSIEIINTAFESGINFIDTANIYSNWVEGNLGGVAESIIGKWLAQSHIPREQVIIATKVRGRMGDAPNDEGLSRKHILDAIEGSLRRLRTDYIDIYLTHWYDEHTPIDETLRALDDLISQGKVRYIGASNYPAWRLTQALWTSDKLGVARYDMLQPHYNMVHRAEFEQELADVCRTYNLGVTPYSPLAGGFLSGKYNIQSSLPQSERANHVSQKYYNETGWKILKTLRETATQKGCSTSQLALAWLLSDALITSPIIGARSKEQLQDNIGALKISLTQEEREKLSS